MKKLLAIAALLSVSAIAFAAETLEVGTAVDAFYVQDVTGPSAGEKLCYRCQYGNRPVISVFTRTVDDKVALLIKQIDGVVGKNDAKKAAAFVVVLTDEPEAQQGKLKEVAEKQKIEHTPLTVFDGQVGPPAYKIAKDAEVTVMMWVGGELKVNQALKASDLSADKISSLVKESGKILN